MEQLASALADYSKDRLGDGLRAVGYHTWDEFELEYLRDDLVDAYPPSRVKNLIRTSRSIHDNVQQLNDAMGPPEASLHTLKDGLIIQFHFTGNGVVFLSMDKAVGRNFTEFLRDCRNHMN